MITKEEKKQAEALYLRTYKRSPKDDKVKVIDIYEPQSAYLYGRTKEAVDAYKTSQNIIRFMLVYFMWPVIADFILIFFGLLYGMKTADMFNGYFVIGCIFFVLYCGVFFNILWYKARKAEKLYKGQVVWINY